MTVLNHFEKWESYVPVDLADPAMFLIAVGVVYFFVVFRYFLIIAPFYFLFYVRGVWKDRRVYDVMPGRAQVLVEIKWSLLTSVIFAVAGVVIGWMWQMGWTQIYLRFDEYPLWYMPVSLVLMSLVHEVYFYFSHRLMHLPVFYKKIHKIHHLSLKPSPWASFAFHPFESVIEALILPVLLLLIPVHPTVFLTYLTLMTVSAIINHLGVEVLPSNASGHWFWKWWITGTHHGQHHKYFNCNYGLYFTALDRMFKTESLKYESELREVLTSHE